MLRQSYPLDENFQIGIQMDNFYERFPTIIQDNPLSEDLQTQIYKIPGVEKIVLDGCVVGRLVESKVVYDSPEDNLGHNLPPPYLLHFRIDFFKAIFTFQFFFR